MKAYTPTRPLAVHLRHLLLAVARPGHLLRRKRRVERDHLVRHQSHIGRGDVLLEVLPSLRTGNRHDVWAFVQQPGERDLPWGYSLARRQLAHGRSRPHVRVEVLTLVARIAAAEVPG